jgi:hypothetical protein
MTIPTEQLNKILPDLLLTLENVTTALSEAIIEVNEGRMKYNRRSSDKTTQMMSSNIVVDARIVLAEVEEILNGK